jgi:hypothetical protein
MDERTIVPILSKFRHFSMLLQFILKFDADLLEIRIDKKKSNEHGRQAKILSELSSNYIVGMVLSLQK